MRYRYTYGFGNFTEEAPHAYPRIARDILNFQAMEGLGTVSRNGVDMNEFWVTLQLIESATNSLSVSLSSVKDIWSGTWLALAKVLQSEAEQYENEHDHIAAASAYFRASNYFMLAERFLDHLLPTSLSIYNSSVVMFQKGLTQQSPLFTHCLVQAIPYLDSFSGKMYMLHGYWCPGNTNIAIIVLTGLFLIQPC